MISSPWTDIGATSAAKFERMLQKPINIKRSEFQEPRHLMPGDALTVQFSQKFYSDQSGRLVKEEIEMVTPPVPFAQEFLATHVTKFEVIDEFGDDVGVGVVIGGRKL